MTTRLFVLGALLLPAAAFAQPADPNAAPPPAAPAPTVQNPNTVTNTQSPSVVVNPAPAPQPVAPTTVVEPAPATIAVAPAGPDYEEVEDSYNAPIFMSGALVFAASYGASVITAASSDDNDNRGNHRLYVPVVGPWLALSDRGSCDISKSSCDHETTAKVLLVADGVFQAAGVIGMLDGLFQPSTHRVITHTAKLDTKIHLQPTMVQGDPGVSVFGHF